MTTHKVTYDEKLYAEFHNWLQQKKESGSKISQVLFKSAYDSFMIETGKFKPNFQNPQNGPDYGPNPAPITANDDLEDGQDEIKEGENVGDNSSPFGGLSGEIVNYEY